MKIAWNAVGILAALMVFQTAEASSRDRYVERSPVPLIAEAMAEPAAQEAEEMLEQAQEVVEAPAVVTAQQAPREPAAQSSSLADQVKELEADVDLLLRMVDPDNRGDERRLENRLRELESAVDSLRNEVRRLETMVRR